MSVQFPDRNQPGENTAHAAALAGLVVRVLLWTFKHTAKFTLVEPLNRSLLCFRESVYHGGPCALTSTCLENKGVLCLLVCFFTVSRQTRVSLLQALMNSKALNHSLLITFMSPQFWPADYFFTTSTFIGPITPGSVQSQTSVTRKRAILCVFIILLIC